MALGPLELIVLAVLGVGFIGWIIAIVAAVRSESTGAAIALIIVPVLLICGLCASGAFFWTLAAAPAPMPPAPVVVARQPVSVSPPMLAPEAALLPHDDALVEVVIAAADEAGILELSIDQPELGEWEITASTAHDADAMKRWIAAIEASEAPAVEVVSFENDPARVRVRRLAGGR